RERRHAMVAESDSEIRMAADELNSLRNGIASSVADLLATLERREKLVSLYKTGIIPQAEQSLESAVIGYRVNKVDFLTLLDSRIALFNYERELYESQAEYMMGLARLEATVGTDVSAAAEQMTALPADKPEQLPVTPVAPPSEHTPHH
ncbi:MAG: TolC family protein, partial [Geobacteraceae bacterium]|nr:TolC family protein [Geobacteraceae bacterium]